MPPPDRPRILLLIPHLGGGGAEHVVETLARRLDSAKYEVHLALITQSEHSVPSLPASVTLHELRTCRVRSSAPKLLLLIWQLRPHVILSGIAHLNLLVLLLRPLLPRRTRIVARQNGALTATLAAHSQQCLARHAYRLVYRRADTIVCQTQSMAEELQRELHVSPQQVTVLPNPTDLRHIRTSIRSARFAPAATGKLRLLAAGRLVREKGFDLILEAFATLPRRFAETELIIAGEGPERSFLERQSTVLHIQHRVHFAGHIPDPITHFSASLFVLSSRTEGLPNILLEAAAAGLPIVSTPASPGLIDLLQHHDGVWLASDTSAGALRRALERALSLIQPAQRYPHPWIEPYGIARAIPAYEAAIDSVIARSGD